MTYRITGLDPAPFASLFTLSDEALAAQGARRVTASAQPGFPCRVSLADAEPGETLILLNHVSHDVIGPYRSTHAIYVREGAAPATYDDETPPVFGLRVLSLRGFDGEGMIVAAALAQPGEADAGIRALFADPAVHYIHAHNAARGCFAARVERA